MKGLVFLGNKNIELREFADPEPDINEVVIEVKVSAICGSDLHFYHAAPDYLKTYIYSKKEIISGHEPSGVVYKTGKKVTNIKIGDRVSIYHYIGCEHCKHCLSGNIMFCKEKLGLGWNVHGANAKYLRIKAKNCLPLSDKLSFIDGAFLSCIASTAYSALKKINPFGNDTLTIFGLGPVGLTIILLAKSYY